MSDLIKLLPCPFCGNPPRIACGFLPSENTKYVSCPDEDCSLFGQILFFPEEWNTRSDADEIKRLTKQLVSVKSALTNDNLTWGERVDEALSALSDD